MALAADTSSATLEDPRFLQHRIGRFGLMGAVIALGSLIGFRTLLVALDLRYDLLTDPTMVLHLVGGLLFLLIWLLCRGRSRSRRYLRAVETGGLLASSVSFMAMGPYIPLTDRPDLIVILALTFGFVARALYVPSSGRRTMLLGLALMIPLIAVNYHSFLQVEAARWGHLHPDGTPFTAERIAASIAILTAMWWGMTVTVSTAASRVIYGLRKEVRDMRRLGQYTLEEKLGQGGMGQVWKARHAMLRRPTAVKLLAPDLVGEETLARFEREVQNTARLTHPNTITIFDYGRTPEGVFYYAMEMVEGATLAEVVAVGGPQSPGRVIAILVQIAEALSEAHVAGLIHRDIKPSNVMLCQRGGVQDTVKVLDFGMVKETSGPSEAHLTQADTLLGTPLYMAPESIRSPLTADARSDLYALGAVGYFLMTGTNVFSGNNALEICGHHLHTPPEPPTRRLGRPIPVGLEEIVLSCLEKDPERRPPAAAALADQLRLCPEAGSWTRTDAAQWWQDHGSDLAARRRQRPAPEPGSTFLLPLGVTEWLKPNHPR